MGAAAQEQGVLLVGEGGGERFDVLVQVQDLFYQARQASEGADVGADHFRGAVVGLGQRGGQPQHCNQLGGEGLGGGYADLWAGFGQQAPVGFTDQGAAGNVTDGQAGQVALLFGVTQRCKGICSLAGLGDGNEKGIGWYRHLAVTILAGDFYLTWQPCLLFNPVPGDQTGMVAGAAGDDVDVLDVFKPGFRLRAKYGGEYVILAQCAFQRIRYGDGLFVDFLEHEVAVLALLQAVGGVLVAQYRVFHQLVLPVPDFSGLQRQTGMVALFQIDELIGYLQQGQGVGGYESFFAALAYDQRAAHTCTVQRIGLVLMDYAQGVGAVELGQGGAEGAEQGLFLAVVMGQQVGDYFGVGFRGEAVAQLLELLAQLVMVLDDAVVDYSQPL